MMNIKTYLDDYICLLTDLRTGLFMERKGVGASIPTPSHSEKLKELWDYKDEMISQILPYPDGSLYLQKKGQEIYDKFTEAWTMLEEMEKTSYGFSMYLGLLTNSWLNTIREKGITIGEPETKTTVIRKINKPIGGPETKAAVIRKINKSIGLKCSKVLCELLKESSYIPNDTKQEHFDYVFSGGEMPNDYKKLTWAGSDVLCVYLISELFTGVTTDWSTAREFRIKDPDKKKVNYTNNKDEKPRGHKAIDDILKKMKEA